MGTRVLLVVVWEEEEVQLKPFDRSSSLDAGLFHFISRAQHIVHVETMET
jgi:hypothetical protein